jgi:hypothetical protein
LQTTLAADAHLAEGQFLHEKQTLIHRVGTRRPIIIIIIINIPIPDILQDGKVKELQTEKEKFHKP